jgi:hypothetical protein
LNGVFALDRKFGGPMQRQVIDEALPKDQGKLGVAIGVRTCG